MEYYIDTDIGNLREQNEDFALAIPNLFIVADGMGGHAAGEIASKIAVNTFVEFFNDFSRQNKTLNNSESIKTLLLESIKYANKKVYELSCANKEYFGMGTTFTACYINKNKAQIKAHIIHIGDSRIYLKNVNTFKLLTEDHTVVWQMYKSGLLTYQEIFSHPLRNYLENVLGTSSEIKADYLEEKLKKDDILLLCTDGLNSMVDDNKINKILSNKLSLEQICKKLIEEAKKNGGLDNITIILIKI